MQETPSNWTDKIEETLIAFFLGTMTLLTFANVVMRYVFNSNILWALELTVFMFGWLVLLGASYAVKKGGHLGVDAVLVFMSPNGRRSLGLLSTAFCLFFAVLMMKGAWDYWANFANLPQTTGRWFPTGFEENFRGRGWYETQDVPVPGFMRFLETWFNDGDEYEKLPKVVPYLVMPLSMLLLFVRFVQAGLRIWRGETDRLVASHEVEDEIEEAAARAEGIK